MSTNPETRRIADKIIASQKRVHAAMLGLHIGSEGIDFDVDTRWDTVSAITTFKYRGKSYRVTVEEVVGE
jgi:hypothetical protein